MKDYRALLPTEAPEGLMSWALQREMLVRGAMVYHTEWVDEPYLAPALEERRPHKIRVVRGVCSACAREMDFAYVKTEKDGYGFLDDEVGLVTAGEDLYCPMCGEIVAAKLASGIGRGCYVADEDVVTSACLLEGGALALIEWNLRREVGRYGNETYKARPLEAYVFDREGCAKLSRWTSQYNPYSGNTISFSPEWRQPKEWRETLGAEQEIYGLTPELIAESCLPDCKLDLYMQHDPFGSKLYPVLYLLLYQRYPQVENLVVQGVKHLLNKEIDAQKPYNWNDVNRKGRLRLEAFDWTQRRPAQMLRLDKDEFATLRRHDWEVWRVYVKAKAVGDRMRIPEELDLLWMYGVADIEEIIGMAPVGRCLRYLLHQMEIYGLLEIYGLQEGEETDPYDVLEDDTMISATELRDYWSMCREVGWDLDDTQVRWPHDFPAAHARAVSASQARRRDKAQARMREVHDKLVGMAYTSGELMIYPAGSQAELTREGKLLHHCVGGYAQAHTSGRPIFFIRHTWAAWEPYFTLQLDEAKRTVIQNRGLRNCARTPEIEAFEREWLRWLKKGCPRDKSGRPVGARPPVWMAQTGQTA